MGRKKKFEEGTADAFRLKKIQKITKADVQAIVDEIRNNYTIAKNDYDNAIDKEQAEKIEKQYFKENGKDIDLIKKYGKDYFNLQPGVRSIIGPIFFNTDCIKFSKSAPIRKRKK